MKVLIVGCGRTGSRLARNLVAQDHEVTVIDDKREAFANLGAEFTGATLQGSGLDREVLKRASAGTFEVAFALTGGDNRNLMLAQMFEHQFNIKRAIARLHDPVRAAKYRELGVHTLCTTTVIEGLMNHYVNNGQFPELPDGISITGDAFRLTG